MAPNKARAAGVSASSFLDLKAELSKQESEFSKQKAAGKYKFITGGIKRPDKKPTVWARQNKGVGARSARDLELELSKPTLENARAALEKKALLYDKLKRGKSGGLSDRQYDSLLVDFDQKAVDDNEDDSDDVDESLTVPRPPELDDDPMVEWEDEFGRLRKSRRSEIPRDLQQPSADVPEDDPDVIYNPANHFPVYEPSADRIASIQAAASEEANPLEAHYEADKEVRAKGAAFYNFSKDEEARLKEMEGLRAAREETERTRQEKGAVDARVGEIEGMVATDAPGSTKSRALEKRKREIEDRRKLLEAKRRKASGGSSGTPSSSATTKTSSHADGVSSVLSLSANILTASPPPSKDINARPAMKQVDPALSAADMFLAELDRDILSHRMK